MTRKTHWQLGLIPFTHTIYTLITHKIEKGGYLEENPRKVSTTHPPLLSHCYTLRGDLYPNTTHTYLECRECFGDWEVLRICQKKLVRLGGCNRAYYGIQKTKENTVRLSQLVAGAWKAQVDWVD